MSPNGKTTLALDLQVKRQGSEHGSAYRYVELRGRAIHGAVITGENVQVVGESHGDRIEAHRIVSETTGATVWPGRFHFDLYFQPRVTDQPTVEGKVIEIVGPRPDGGGVVLDLYVQYLEGAEKVTTLVEMRAPKIRGSVMRMHDVAVYGEWDRGLLRARRIHTVDGCLEPHEDVSPDGYTSAKVLAILFVAVATFMVYELVQRAT
jgi:hypothetical protein